MGTPSSPEPKDLPPAAEGHPATDTLTAPKPTSTGTRRETIKTLVIMLIAAGVLGVVFAVALGWEIPGLTHTKAKSAKTGEAAPLKVELVKDPNNPNALTNTLSVPDDVRAALGIRKDNADIVAIASLPTFTQSLEFPGSTALNPAMIARIRIRFPTNGCEVVSIGKTIETFPPTKYRELRPGDTVKAGQDLATFYSVDVGSVKMDLINAICQLKLDQEIYERATSPEARGAIPEVQILNAWRNVAGDITAINKAVKTLETWNILPEDIQAVRKEGEELSKMPLDKRILRTVDPEKEKLWGQVVLKAPFDGVIIERNLTQKEVIVDNTVNVFQIVNVDTLLVLVNVPEDQVHLLRELKNKGQLNWTIQTAGAPAKLTLTQKSFDALRASGIPAPLIEKLQALTNKEFSTRTDLDAELVKSLTQGERENWQRQIGDAAKVGLVGPIDEISYLIDQNTHTAVVKGFIKNEGRALRAGQYVTATIDLPREENVVEVPMAAIADDGRQAVVFVQPDPTKPLYTMRRVLLTHRFDKVAFVKSVLTDADIALGREQVKDGLLPFSPLQRGDRVLTSGILELKKELDDRQSALAAAKKP